MDPGPERDAITMSRGVKRDREEAKPLTGTRVLTPAQKKLAATNIKGMKTMASFFGKKG